MKTSLSLVQATLCDVRFPHTTPVECHRPMVYFDDGHEDPFDILSTIFSLRDENAKFWWNTTGLAFAQMLKHASYPIPQQYRYLIFYYLMVLPEFGPAPIIVQAPQKFTHPTSLSAPFNSYMTDDHSPIELSWLFEKKKGAVTRFAIDPVQRQLKDDPRGPMVIFEHLKCSNFLARGVDLDWCRVLANSLTCSAIPQSGDLAVKPQYPSQYFVGFDFSTSGVVMKAYFLPETRAVTTCTTKSALITSCIVEISTPTRISPNPPDLLTPWKRVLAFFASLPSDVAPTLPIVAVDCVSSRKNRIKVYARTPRATFANLRRFLTLGRDISYTSPVTQRALKQITMMWHILFPATAGVDTDDVEPPCPQHPTNGLLWYYELRPGYAEPFPKVYLPVRHWCNSDQEIVRVMQTFYTMMGDFKAAERYERDVRETFTHRPLSARTGIHTYITFAVKPDDVEITSYFNPECYSAERTWLY